MELIEFKKCPICLEKINQKYIYFLPCSHFFHEKCISYWLENNITCPNCRVPIFIKSLNQYLTFLKFIDNAQNNNIYLPENYPLDYNSLAILFARRSQVELKNYEYGYNLLKNFSPYDTHSYEDDFDVMSDEENNTILPQVIIYPL